MSGVVFKPLPDEEWISSSSRSQNHQQQPRPPQQQQQQQQQQHQIQVRQGFSYNQRIVPRRPSEPPRRRGQSSHDVEYNYPQPRDGPEYRRSTQYGSSRESRPPEGSRLERLPLGTGDAVGVWNAFACSFTPEDWNRFSSSQGDQGNLGPLARNIPLRDPRGRPTPGLLYAREQGAARDQGTAREQVTVRDQGTAREANMVRPASRPGVWTYARSTSPPTPIATTNRVSTVPQDQRWSDIDTERPLKQTREPSEATSSSRNEDTEFDTVSTTAAPAANQVATDLLISIGGPESEDSQDDEESEFEVALERRRGSRTTSSRSNDSAIRSQVSDTVADLLNLGLDFTAGDKLEISDTDWIKALDGMKSAAKTQDQDKNKNSDAIFGPEKVLIDFFASSASDRSLTPAPSSGSAGNLMFNSVEQDEPVTDLIGALDESTATLPSKLTGGTEKEANEVSAFNNHRDDLEELFSLKAVWQESHQRGDYGIDNDTNSDSDNDSYDSDATDATDATDADPWRILADDKIFLSMDALESIRLDLQQHNVTWEQLLTEVKI